MSCFEIKCQQQDGAKVGMDLVVVGDLYGLILCSVAVFRWIKRHVRWDELKPFVQYMSPSAFDLPNCCCCNQTRGDDARTCLETKT